MEQEVRRNMVVKTAMELFRVKGIKDVTMDDIAHRLKMSKRTLYELFDDKESLFLPISAKRCKSIASPNTGV